MEIHSVSSFKTSSLPALSVLIKNGLLFVDNSLKRVWSIPNAIQAFSLVLSESGMAEGLINAV